ncbi:hypothetical protein [Sediminibacterium goheungense]|uniref:Sensor of ECF-type sigma factor n=1 Tax=Sediminibacterium goheungense TaxID=1086393 RepID=A0A4R6J2D8_9BACT|nr:hypothetical protein [Sediminibacterium goheungense]TDO28941.1 hypothetical protein BC659_1023 [Sediminibacterium goheungense]
MKKIILFFITVFALSSLMAQEPQRKMMGERKNIEVLKVAYFTKHLSLTTEEAEKFWPLYNSYTADIRKARGDNKDDILAFEEAVLNIRKKYKTDLKKILVTDERVNKALMAEREFMNVVRKELQQRMEQRKKVREQKITDQ